MHFLIKIHCTNNFTKEFNIELFHKMVQNYKVIQIFIWQQGKKKGESFLNIMIFPYYKYDYNKHKKQK